MLKIDVKTTGDLQAAALAAVKKQIEDKVTRAVGAGASSLRVEVRGSSLDNLTLSVSGPDDLVAKAKKALGVR